MFNVHINWYWTVKSKIESKSDITRENIACGYRFSSLQYFFFRILLLYSSRCQWKAIAIINLNNSGVLFNVCACEFDKTVNEYWLITNSRMRMLPLKRRYVNAYGRTWFPDIDFTIIQVFQWRVQLCAHTHTQSSSNKIGIEMYRVIAIDTCQFQHISDCMNRNHKKYRNESMTIWNSYIVENPFLFLSFQIQNVRTYDMHFFQFYIKLQYIISPPSSS